ncbi:MAG TPA: tetratricopeptide repeat protein, partial [Gemmataceae bacterium]|nr:tetratricopeptide repeat protein [Gemmataceae bacterium]
MRRLNVKLFLYVAGSVMLLSGAVFTVHQLQAGNIRDGLLWQARQAEKDGKLIPAARYYNRYLDFVPDDLDARAQLGRTLSDPRVANTPRARNRARFVLEQVLTRDPNRHDVRRCLIRLALDTRDPELADEHLNFLEKTLPGDGEVAGLRGQWQELKGNGDAALKHLRDAVAKAPDMAENHVRLINLLRRKDAGRHGDLFKEAQQCLAAALARLPDDAGVLLAAAELAGDKGDLKEARSRLERVLQLNSKDAKAHLAMARLELRASKRADAIAGLKNALQLVTKEDGYELNWMLANVHIDADELDAARAIIAQMQETNPSPGAADYLQGRCLMQQGRWFEASRLLERVRSATKGVPALAVQVDLHLGVCYERLEEPAQQLAACLRAAEMDPMNVQARQGIAAARWALGQADAAIADYREVVNLNKQFQNPVTGRVELARLMLLRALRSEQRNWRGVADELELAAKEQPDAIEVPLLRAEMFAAKKDMKNAKAVLLLALNDRPKQIEFLTALASLAEREGDKDKAREVLDAAEKQAGDSAELRLARARYIPPEPKEKATAALRQLEEGWQSFPAEKQGALLGGLAEIQYRAGHREEAGRLWRQLADLPRNARDLRLRMLLFDLALKQDDDAGMQRTLDDIKKLEEGESALWLFGEASRHLSLAHRGDRKALNTARALLDRVVALREAWPAVLLAKAELEEMQGNVEQAITHYRRALERGVQAPRVVRNLVQLLSSRQRYDEAEQVMHRLQQAGQTSPELQRVLIDLAQHRGDFARVEAMVNETVSSDSTNYRDHLWRGQRLAARGQASAAAEKALRKAVELADTVPETWVALVQYLTRTAQTPKALEEIDNARAKLKGSKGNLALAQCYESAGQIDKARAQYEAAQKEAPTEMAVRRAFVGFSLRTSAPQQAEAQLREIIARKIPTSEVEMTWARRALALTVSSTTDPRRFREALTLVGLSLDAKGNVIEGPAPPEGWPAEELILRARVLATQPRQVLRLRAVALLEDVFKRQSLPPDEQLLLAQLYDGLGPDEKWWGKAREHMQTLTTTHNRNPLYLSLFAQGLLRHGDLAGAEGVIGRLERLEKERQLAAGALGSVELRAQALERRGRKTDALNLLKRYAEATDAPPERTLLRAGLEGRMGRVKDALDLCEQVRDKCAPEAIGGAGVALLRDGRPKPGKNEQTWREQASRVEKWLDEALGKNPDGLALRLQFADLMDMLGNTKAAAEAYEEVRKKDPRNLVAMNNLSWLWAQQKRWDDALKLVQQAIDAHGPRPELLDTRGYIYLEMGKTAEAVA